MLVAMIIDSLLAARRQAGGADVAARPRTRLRRAALSVLVEDVGVEEPVLLNWLHNAYLSPRSFIPASPHATAIYGCWTHVR